jgi:hypothetical protein
MGKVLTTLNGNGEVWSSRCSPWLARTIPFSTCHAKNPDWFAMGSSFFSPPASTSVNSSSLTAVPPPIGPDNGNPPRAVAKPLPFAALPSSSSSSSSPSPPTPTAKWSMRTALYKSTPVFSSCSTQSSKTQCPTSSSSSQTEPSPERKPCWPLPSSLVRNFFWRDAQESVSIVWAIREAEFGKWESSALSRSLAAPPTPSPKSSAPRTARAPP